MNQRTPIVVLALVAAVSAGLDFARAAERCQRPNFVFFLADDLGWRDAGCYGSTFYQTPNIDRLARQGMRFTEAYAACPVCSPTRASIMTGKYPARLGTTNYFGAPQPDAVARHWTRNKPLLPAPFLEHLSLEETTIAKALRQAGYATYFAGKWHLGGKGYWPEDHDFDVNIGGCQAGAPASYFSPYGNPKLADGPKGEHLDDRMAAESVKFLEHVGKRPFLLYHAFYSVHIPLQAKRNLVAKYEAKRKHVRHDGPLFRPEGEHQARQIQEHPVYAAMIETMDHSLGRILDALDRLGLAENTIVFFMSDNGGLSTAEGAPTSNLPLRAGKGWLYEGGIREPMIVKWPGVVEPASVSDVPVISTDFYPTMLEMAGLPLRPRQHVDGASLVPLLRRTASLPPRACIGTTPTIATRAAVRAAPCALPTGSSWSSLRTTAWNCTTCGATWESDGTWPPSSRRSSLLCTPICRRGERPSAPACRRPIQTARPTSWSAKTCFPSSPTTDRAMQSRLY